MRSCRRLGAFVLTAVLFLTPPAPAQEPNAIQKRAELTILQLNDVYETTPVDGLGGVARVATLKKNIAKSGATPLVVLAGDFLSSSVASSVFKGQQMVDAFNAMGLDLATLGNHEFDFGKDMLLKRMAESKFQYVIANVLDDTTGRPVGGAQAYLVRTFGALKVGFFGLCLTSTETSANNRRGLRFIDPMVAAERAVAALRRQHVDTIVAITHLRYEDDHRLAVRFPDIGLIIGGHEHFPIATVINRTLISKAGSDAKSVSRIDLHREPSGVERHLATIPIDAKLADDPATAAVVSAYESKLTAELNVVIGMTRVPLDGESQRVRSEETNLGDVITDAMRGATGAEVAIINSGSIRGDRKYPAGSLSRQTLLTMQPFGNVLCVIAAPGRILLRALNSGTAEWPTAAGRFPQVSGLTFVLNRSGRAGDRVSDVRVGGTPLAADRTYTIAIPDYLLNGGDGYDMFAGQQVVVGPETGEIVVTALEKYITARTEIAPQTEGRITTR